MTKNNYIREFSPRQTFKVLVASGLMGATPLLTGCEEDAMTHEEPSTTPVLEIDVPNNSVVYGDDDREDVYNHPDEKLQDLAIHSTPAMFGRGAVDLSDPNNITFNASTLEDAFNLCPTERFLSDPAAASCSATLIDDDLVLTAGHCISSASCSNRLFVFNYYRDSSTSIQTITSEDVFECEAVVARALGGGLDHAIVRLDRSATPRFTPAPVSSSAPTLSQGDFVAVLGSGSGIPTKIDDGGRVRTPRSSTLDYFVATTDTFGGNSGSGVYELENYTVAGILVRGEVDYVSNGSCNIPNPCAEDACRGEDISYARTAILDFCAQAESERLCSAVPPATPAETFDFSTSGTNSAQTNTSNVNVDLLKGQTLIAGTCGLSAASFTGDTYIRIFSDGTEVTSNDDSCAGFGSKVIYTTPADASLEIRVGCFGAGACSGTLAWQTL